MKGELQELCVLCNVDINEDMTVAKLTELLKPMIAAFKGTGELPPTRVEVAQAKAVAARKSAAKPKPAPKALAVPVLQGTPVNVEPLPPDHQMDPRVARQIMAMRTLMAQHAEPGAELDPWGNPILQVESAQEMMSMLSEAAETVDSMNWEPDYAARAEVLSAGHRPVAGEETVESEVLDDDEVIEDEETPTSPMSRRSVAEPEPEEEYYSPRQSIGRVGKTAMSKLKPGVQQQIAQGLRRSQRLERALGASSSSVREALEAENDRVLTQAALDPEPLLGDVFLPVSPETVLEALVVEKGIKFLKKVGS